MGSWNSDRYAYVAATIQYNNTAMIFEDYHAYAVIWTNVKVESWVTVLPFKWLAYIKTRKWCKLSNMVNLALFCLKIFLFRKKYCYFIEYD